MADTMTEEKRKQIDVSGDQIVDAVEKIPTIEADIKTNAQNIAAVQSTVSQHTVSISSLNTNKANAADVYTKNQTDAAITAKVAEIVAGAPEEFDTLKEMSDWLTNHAESAATMNSAIQKNASDISALDDAKAEKSAVTAVANDVNDINATLYPENKNLLKNTAISQTINGVTFTVNPDKSVTCNGTATENAFFVLGGTTHFSGSAITSGAPVGGGSKVWSIQIYEMVDGVETIRVNDYGEGNTRTYTEGDYFGKIVIREGKTVENLTFYPMLRRTSTDETYEPYKPTVTEQLATLTAEIAALKGV